MNKADLDLSQRIIERLPYIRASVVHLLRKRAVREEEHIHSDLLAAVELLQAASVRLTHKGVRRRHALTLP